MAGRARLWDVAASLGTSSDAGERELGPFVAADLRTAWFFDGRDELRWLHASYDGLEALAGLSTVMERERASASFNDAYLRESSAIKANECQVYEMVWGTRTGIVLPGFDRRLVERVWVMVMPDAGSLFRTVNQIETSLGLMVPACAAQRYFSDTGRYATDWAALIDAGLLGAVPLDPYDGEPARLRVTESGQGCTIYSVNRDLEDDGGRSMLHDENTADDPADLAVRLGDWPAMGEAVTE